MGVWAAICLLGQLDGGLAAPPAPPDVPAQDVALPRVLHFPGKVCVESLDEHGAVKRDCRLEKSGSTAQPRPVETEPLSRAVADLDVLGGVLIVGAAVPEFVFMADVGVRFHSGVGVVGLAHGHLAARDPSTASRYGLGVGLRLGDRSHLLIGTSATFLVPTVFGPLTAGSGVPAVTVLIRFALAFGKNFTVVLMPTFTFHAGGALGSLCLGAGLTL